VPSRRSSGPAIAGVLVILTYICLQDITWCESKAHTLSYLSVTSTSDNLNISSPESTEKCTLEILTGVSL
jgi:hypothetical protein